MRVRLGADHIASLFQIGDDAGARLVAVLSLVFSAVFVNDPLSVDDRDNLQMVALGHGKVIGVGTGGDLHGAGAEIHRHVIVGDDWNFLVHQRQNHLFPDLVAVARIIGMHRHGGVAQHGLRPRRGDDDFALAVGKRVADVPQIALIGLEFHFQVGNRGVAARTPVDDVVALINHIFVVEPDKNLPDRLGEALVHGKAFTVPVAGAAQPFELIDDDAAVFFLPFPDAGNKFFAAEIVPGEPLLAQLLLHHVLRGDARVVHSRHPQGVVSLHSLEADDNVLEGIVERMAHVQHSGHIGRRNDNGKRGRFGFVLCGKKLILQPVVVQSFFGIGRFKRLAQLFHRHGNIALLSRDHQKGFAPFFRRSFSGRPSSLKFEAGQTPSRLLNVSKPSLF